MATCALVATSSICQGEQVEPLWGYLLHSGINILFGVKPFKWRNNASSGAAVKCVIIGFSKKDNHNKFLFSDTEKWRASNISPYLAEGENILVKAASKPIFSNLPKMEYGNKAADNGYLILSKQEKLDIIKEYPESEIYFRILVGSEEFVKGRQRFCLWISDTQRDAAERIPQINNKIACVKKYRTESKDRSVKSLINRPYQFREQKLSYNNTLIIAATGSERRLYIPADIIDKESIVSLTAFAIFDPDLWQFSIISSRIHRQWIYSVCGQLKSDIRYSNTLGWNTFPVPKFTDEQLEALSASARRILKCRYSHYPKTIADLYDPDKMPDDLRAVHKENDDLLESMYIGRPFRNDTERLETLFKLYAAKIKTLETASKKKKA